VIFLIISLYLILDPNQQQQQPFSQTAYPQSQQPYYPPQNFTPQQNFYPPNNQAPYNPPQGQQFNMSQPGWTDPEDPEAKGIEFNDESIRKAFIRKVFAILSVRQKTILFFRIPFLKFLFPKGSTKLNFGSDSTIHIYSCYIYICAQQFLVLYLITIKCTYFFCK
jgi:hypothetical protein